jgi:hypothetical protein
LAVCGVLILTSAVGAQQGALQTAADKLGVAKIKTLQVTGAGRQLLGRTELHQLRSVAPASTVKNYTALVNYDTASMRVELVREMGAVMPKGGGAPFFGEQRQIQVVSGNYAWNVPVAPPNAAAGAAAPMPQPNPDAAPERMVGVWSTPIGFVKGAMANNATDQGQHVSFTVGGKYKFEGPSTGRDRSRSPHLDRSADRRRHADRDDLHRATGTSAACCIRHGWCRPRTGFRRSTSPCRR